MNREPMSGMLLMGVGGGGCRLAAAVLSAYGDGVRALGMDTDALSIRTASEGGLTCLLLGGSRLTGHGTGGDAIMGRLAVQDDLPNLTAHVQGVRSVVLVTCLGSGTGGGATPEVVKALHDQGIATLCFATLPFAFEGEARRKAAERVLPMIEEHADSVVVLPLDDLFADTQEPVLTAALEAADRVLATAVTLLWRLVSTPGFIALDEERLHAMVVKGGNARFGFASAEGPERALRAAETLRGCRTLRNGDALSKANALLFGILAGRDLRLAEVGDLMGRIRACCKKECVVEMGTVQDQGFEGRIELVALAFESWTAASSVAPIPDVSAGHEPPVAESFPIRPGGRRSRAKGSKLSFGATGRGKFDQVEPTLHAGQDLDIPTFVRRGITLER
jgi:cell division protein FtsZ